MFLDFFRGVWEQRKFNEVFDFMQNNALSRAELSNSEGEIMNVHYGDILVKYGEVLDVKKDALTYLLDASIVKKYQASVLHNGDVIIADAAEDETVGKCSEIAGLTDEIVLSGLHTIPCRPKEKYAEGFLGYYMNSNAYHNQLLPLLQGTKVSSISKSAIQDTDILYPKSEVEQKQIGAYFRNLDYLITLHQRKNIGKMYIYKISKFIKLSNEKITWEQRKLGEVAKSIYGGGTPKTSIPEYWDGEIPWIQSSNLQEEQLFDVEIQKSITEVGLEKSAAKLVPANSIAVVTHVGVGKLVYMPFQYTTSQDFTSLSDLKTDAIFTCYSIYRRLQNELHVVQGSAIKGITKDDLLTKEIMIPCMEEQRKIGAYFRKLDYLITLHQRKPFLIKYGGVYLCLVKLKKQIYYVIIIQNG